MQVATSLVLASPIGFAQLVRSTGFHAKAGSLSPAVKPNRSVLGQAASEVGDELFISNLDDG